MTTAIGKELRKLRIDREERLLDMARNLSKSSAFVSAVETGRKSPPVQFEELVIERYGLQQKAADALRQAADQSRESFTLRPASASARDTAGLLARRMNDLSDDQLKKIRSILAEDRTT